MGYQVYRVGKRTEPGYRYGGYGVPAYCEFPSCEEEIDRGVSFACGDEPFSEYGCDRYFCSKHKRWGAWDEENEKWCDCEDDCDHEFHHYCDRCLSGDDSFPYKPEHPEWVYHVLNHESWGEWRKENPEMVEEYKKLPARPAEGEKY